MRKTNAVGGFTIDVEHRGDGLITIVVKCQVR